MLLLPADNHRFLDAFAGLFDGGLENFLTFGTVIAVINAHAACSTFYRDYNFLKRLQVESSLGRNRCCTDMQ